MLVLGINTVGDICEAALVEGGAIAQLSEPMSNGHDARLAPLVERLMREAGKSFNEVGRIAVIAGPGSFTGVRVGVAFARGLSLALGIPSAGVTSLEALEGLPPGKRILGLLPAKRRPPQRTWWAQLLDSGKGAMAPVELDEHGVRALSGDVAAICGGVEGVPDIGRPRIAAAPAAREAAILVGRLEGEFPLARPIYVREPDATPMERS
jgi:tRNA threonylcarbamoyladenosine biosynthesis protein TsaB